MLPFFSCRLEVSSILSVYFHLLPFTSRHGPSLATAVPVIVFHLKSRGSFSSFFFLLRLCFFWPQQPTRPVTPSVRHHLLPTLRHTSPFQYLNPTPSSPPPAGLSEPPLHCHQPSTLCPSTPPALQALQALQTCPPASPDPPPSPKASALPCPTLPTPGEPKLITPF